MATKQKKKYSKSSAVLLGSIVAILAGLIITGIVFFSISIHQKRELIKGGTTTTAVVDAHNVSTSYTAKAGSHTTYTIEYHFNDPATNKVVYTKGLSVSKGEYEVDAVGSFITISYLPTNPSVNQPVSDLKRISPTYGIFITLIGVVVAVAVYNVVSKKISKRFNFGKRKGARWTILYSVIILAVIFIGAVLGVYLEILLNAVLL